MAASIKIYTNEACTEELGVAVNNTDYNLPLGPEFGLDGDSGDRADKLLYVKNVGDQPAVNTRLTKTNDPDQMVSVFIGQDELKDSEVSLGDILRGAVVPIMIRVSVPKGSLPGNFFPDFEVRFKTMP